VREVGQAIRAIDDPKKGEPSPGTSRHCRRLKPFRDRKRCYANFNWKEACNPTLATSLLDRILNSYSGNAGTHCDWTPKNANCVRHLPYNPFFFVL
jgi:hypothetical protein